MILIFGISPLNSDFLFKELRYNVPFVLHDGVRNVSLQWLSSFFVLPKVDVLLIVVVTLLACGVAYIRQPMLKAFILFLPLPSTVVILSLGKPVDTSYLLSMPLLMIFFYLIYVLHVRGNIPVVIAIIVSTVIYCLVGGEVRPFLPKSNGAFYQIYLAIGVLTYTLYRWTSGVEEQGYQTPLPLYIKAPIIILVVFFLVKIKYYLSGFMAGFPMVGVVGTYETRHCLRTVFRKLPLMIFCTSTMFAVCFAVQDDWGLYGGIAAGWGAYFILLILLRRQFFGSMATSNQ
jgi:hypothetical protein